MTIHTRKRKKDQEDREELQPAPNQRENTPTLPPCHSAGSFLHQVTVMCTWTDAARLAYLPSTFLTYAQHLEKQVLFSWKYCPPPAFPTLRFSVGSVAGDTWLLQTTQRVCLPVNSLPGQSARHQLHSTPPPQGALPPTHSDTQHAVWAPSAPTNFQLPSPLRNLSLTVFR